MICKLCVEVNAQSSNAEAKVIHSRYNPFSADQIYLPVSTTKNSNCKKSSTNSPVAGTYEQKSYFNRNRRDASIFLIRTYLIKQTFENNVNSLLIQNAKNKQQKIISNILFLPFGGLAVIWAASEQATLRVQRRNRQCPKLVFTYYVLMIYSVFSSLISTYNDMATALWLMMITRVDFFSLIFR